MRTEDALNFSKEPETLTISRAAAILGLSRSTIGEAIKAGQLQTHQISKRKYILKSELLTFLKK